MRARLLFPAACLLFVASTAPAANFPETEVRAAITRALPYIEKQGVDWIENRKCVSCHRVSFMTWSLEAAESRGFVVDRAKLDEWRQWSYDELLTLREKDKKAVAETNLEGASQILFAERGLKLTEAQREARTKFAEFLVKGQKPDGTWTPGGQLPGQKRPNKETVLVSTAWNTLALADFDTDAAQAAREKSLARLAQPEEAVSTEWFAMRLLLAVRAQSAADIETWSKKLRDLQQSDGGWGWLTADKSDSLATGMGLYALSAAGVSVEDPAVLRAVQFLIPSQGDDGAWTVMGTKEGKKTKAEETARYWGACWAVLGLTSTLPEAGG